jgi:hypothetical protein
VLDALRAALASPGAAATVTPVLTPRAMPGAAGPVHIDISGGAFEHVEVRVRGGHLQHPAQPAGLDVVTNARGTVDVRVLATDTLGRSGEASLLLRGATGNEPR